MVMELIRATSHQGGFSLTLQFSSWQTGGLPTKGQSLDESPTNHCSLFLNNTLNVVKDP